MKSRTPLAVLAVLSLAAVAACGDDGGGPSNPDAAQAKGPITIWYSNNAQEVAWGKQAVDAWNAAHADQKVTAQEIPAGSSSEAVIGAAITGGNAPCLIYNTSPAAVPTFQAQGGLVPLDDFADGASYVTERSGATADQYKSEDGKFYQLPWKANPVMLFYNKAALKKAGVDPENPPLATYAEFLDTSRKIVASKAAKFAIYPSPSSQFFQPWFDFYPLYAAESGGELLVKDKKATFDSDAGKAVAGFWKQIYLDNLAGKETYNGDAFADGTAAMSTAGPWAIAAYKDAVDWGATSVPTQAGGAMDQPTFSDAKNVAMYTACQNRGTAWEFLKFTTSQEQDGQLLEMTGQMPLRQNLEQAYPDYFAQNPDYKTFAAKAATVIEVPNVKNSVEVWQTFRDAWTKSVIFGEEDPNAALSGAATKINELVQ